MNILLLGGIGSGKSEALKILKEEHNANIIEADKVAHFLYEKDRAGYTALKSLFGDTILDDKKDIDRKKLKEIVFENKDKLEKLNGIIHPKVIDFYKELKEKNTDEVIIFDVPLLFESGIDKFCNKILVVISDYEVQLNRIVERDKINRELAEKIIKSQMSNEERIKKADVVIENNSNLEDLFKKVERFCETIWR